MLILYMLIQLLFLWCQLPERSVETIAIKQQLLSQYDILQSRIKGLKEAAEKEVSSHSMQIVNLSLKINRVVS